MEEILKRECIKYGELPLSRATDCSQVTNDEVHLVSLEDIKNLFKEHYTTPEDGKI